MRTARHDNLLRTADAVIRGNRSFDAFGAIPQAFAEKRRGPLVHARQRCGVGIELDVMVRNHATEKKIAIDEVLRCGKVAGAARERRKQDRTLDARRSEEHTSELQSRENLVCRLLLEK